MTRSRRFAVRSRTRNGLSDIFELGRWMWRERGIVYFDKSERFEKSRSRTNAWMHHQQQEWNTTFSTLDFEDFGCQKRESVEVLIDSDIHSFKSQQNNEPIEFDWFDKISFHFGRPYSVTKYPKV